MSGDSAAARTEAPERTILILCHDGTYWLAEGEDHLAAMLRGTPGGFPVPVRCAMFDDLFTLQRLLGEGRPLSDLWAVNPAIIDRLRHTGDLAEMPGPALAAVAAQQDRRQP